MKKLAAIFFFFFYIVFAQSNTVAHTSPIPEMIPTEETLLKFFPFEIKIQKGGFCHMHTGYNLFMANCFRATGKLPSISIEQLRFEHYRSTASGFDKLDNGQGIDGGMLTAYDGGYPEKTLEFIINKKGCTADSSFVLKQDFFAFADSVNNYYHKEYYKEPLSYQRQVTCGKQAFKVVYNKYLESIVKNEKTDDSYKYCFENHDYVLKKGRTNLELICARINKGDPIYFDYTTHRGNLHAVVGVGCKKIKDKLEFVVIDSNSKKPVHLSFKSNSGGISDYTYLLPVAKKNLLEK